MKSNNKIDQLKQQLEELSTAEKQEILEHLIDKTQVKAGFVDLHDFLDAYKAGIVSKEEFLQMLSND